MPQAQAPAVALSLTRETQSALVDPQCTMVLEQCIGMPIRLAIQLCPEELVLVQHIAELQTFIEKRGLLVEFKACAQPICATKAHH